MSIDGDLLLKESMAATCQTNATLEVDIGPHYLSADDAKNDDVKVWFDNVLVDVK
jgi:hypothetical protein